jgi:hypothetical protein
MQRRIQFRHLHGRAPRGGNFGERPVVGRSENNGVLAVPGPAAAIGSVAELLCRSARGFDLLELAFGKESDETLSEDQKG